MGLGSAGIYWDHFAYFCDLTTISEVRGDIAPAREHSSSADVVSVVPMPGKPFQSKLEPFYAFIRDCRAKRWSYVRIATAITDQHGMKVSANAVFSFVKVRSKGRRLYTLPLEAVSESANPIYSPARGVDPDLAKRAATFFNPPDESSKSETNQTKHEKRPYRLNF